MRSSELILNTDGSIYHLHLLPEQIAPLILTVGDPDRVEKVSRYFDQIEYKVQKREFITHTGRIGKKRLSVISTGIGPDNIDIVLNEIDALFNIDLDTRSPKPQPFSLRIIRLGTAGGLQAEIPVDSLVVSAGGIGMDGLLQFYDAPDQQEQPLLDALRRHFAGQWSFPLAPYYAAADPGLLAHFQPGLYSGYTATNPGFYGPQGRQLRAPARWPAYLDRLQSFSFEDRQVLNLEMETAAIYGLSQLLGHKALSVSAILANRPLGQFSRDSDALLVRLIETCLEKIEAGW